MLSDDTRREIENITSGALIEGKSDHCTTIRNFLCRSFETSKTVKKDFESKAVLKKEQAVILGSYCEENGLFQPHPSTDRYLTRGGEAEIYLDSGNRHVLKVNDGVYYATWLEFFNSILLHNLFFQNTSYELMGILKKKDVLFAVLRQQFIHSDALVDLLDIKKILEFNGFQNNRRHDYVHKSLGLILEDMHDENVLVNSETLFFIDTVFYTITPENE